jgi:hypothetical protein
MRFMRFMGFMGFMGFMRLGSRFRVRIKVSGGAGLGGSGLARRVGAS